MVTVEELKKDLLFDISSQFMMAGVPKEDYQAIQTKVIELIAVVQVEEAEKIRVKLEACWKDIASVYAPPDEKKK